MSILSALDASVGSVSDFQDVGGERLELSRVTPYAPQTYVSASSTTRPVKRFYHFP